jgi:hypothetical protein
MNEKFIYAAMSVSPKPGDTNTPDYYAEKARSAYSEIQRLTRAYNTEVAGGKWNKMMDWKPRNRPVFRMPALAASPENKEVFKPDSPVAIIDAANYAKLGEGTSAKLQLLKGLGANGSSITMLPFTSPSISDENAKQAPFAEYDVELLAGQHSVEVICTPTQKIHEGRGLRYALFFGDESPTIVDVHSAAETPPWEKNVLRGYSIGKSTHKLDNAGKIKIRIAPLDPGLLISQIKIY